MERRWEHGGSSLPIGEGSYALVARLASGGMAELFLARRRGLAGITHPVVVKRLRPEAQRDPSILRMFVQEAWISAQLHHPNVVRFHDFVFHEGCHYLILEYVPGCDLAAVARSFFAEGRPFPIEELLEIGVGMLRALGHAHTLRDERGRLVGLIHRDVSPQNVLLSFEGEIKLIDFGVAKLARAFATRKDDGRGYGSPSGSRPAADSTGAGVVKGKLGYAAPEQLGGYEVDARADLFGVGVILFELLTGRRLFHRDDDSATVRAVLSGEVPAIAPLRPACPALLEEVVRRALSRSPEARFDDAAQMEEALAEVLASLRATPSERRGVPGFEARSVPVGEALPALVRQVAAGRERTGTHLKRRGRKGVGGPSRAPSARRGGSSRAGGAWGRPAVRGRVRTWPLRLLPWLLLAVVGLAAGAFAARAIGTLPAEGTSIRRAREVHE